MSWCYLAAKIVCNAGINVVPVWECETGELTSVAWYAKHHCNFRALLKGGPRDVKFHQKVQFNACFSKVGLKFVPFGETSCHSGATLYFLINPFVIHRIWWFNKPHSRCKLQIWLSNYFCVSSKIKYLLYIFIWYCARLCICNKRCMYNFLTKFPLSTKYWC